MKHCPRCGTQNDDTRAHCSKCGQDLEAQVCPQGHPLPGGIPPEACPWCPSTPASASKPAAAPAAGARRATADLSSSGSGDSWGAPADSWGAPATDGRRDTVAVDDFNSGGGGSSPPGWDATSSSFGGPSDAGGFGGDTGGFGGGGAGGFGGGGGEPVRRGGTIVMGDGNADPTPFGGGAAPVTGGAARQPTPGGGRGGTVVMDGGFDSDPQQGSGYGQQGSPRPSSGSGSKLVGLLYSFSGDVNGAVWPVRFGRAVLGSSDNCAVRLAFNGVSRNHCQVISRPSPGGQGNIVRIMDLGSVNGTIVNGLDIQGQHALEHGDKIRVGPMELVYVSVPPPGI